MTDLGLCIYNSLWQVDTCHACRLDTAIPIHIDTLQVCKEVVMSVLWPWSVVQQTKSHAKVGLLTCPVVAPSQSSWPVAKNAYNKKRLTATGIVPDLHRIPLSPFAAKWRRIAPNCTAKLYIFSLSPKIMNKKTSATSYECCGCCYMFVNCLGFRVKG